MRRNEDGAALLVTVMAMMLLSAIGAALVLATRADTLIAANAGASSEAFYAADAVFERTLAELRDVPDLTAVLSGAAVSNFVDGAPSGQRRLADGSLLNLTDLVNLANCQKLPGCSEADLNAAIRDRPWASRNPRWRLFSFGPLDRPPGSPTTDLPVYVASMIADDPSDTDDDPWRDGTRTGVSANPGAGVLLVRAEAFGRRGAHRIVEGTVCRMDLVTWARWEAADPATRGPEPTRFPQLQLLTWREVR